jgi:hypothetical protein
MDLDVDPGGPKTYGSGSGYGILVFAVCKRQCKAPMRDKNKLQNQQGKRE